jgi:O-antigen/teichoic acid export membrane protein
LFFNLFDAYIKALYDAVIGTFLKELLQRVFILIAILIYAAGYCEIDVFVFLYVASLSLPTLILMMVLIARGQMKLRKPGLIFNSSMWREIVNLCLYGVLAGFGTIGILQIDSILVNHFLGISQTGIYATCIYFATIILIPSRPLIKISTTLLADAWKNNDLDTISLVYRKSCINQAIAAVLIFIGLWVNIDNIFRLIPPEFAPGKWVIFFAGLANVVEMATGINSTIIQTSRYYRFNTLLIFFFLILLILSAILLIPPYGLTGMALSLLISMVITNAIRFIFLQQKYNLNPFSLRQIIIPVAGGIGYLGGYLLPEFNNYLLDIFIRSMVTAGLFFWITIAFNVSEEINLGYRKIIQLFSFVKRRG